MTPTSGGRCTTPGPTACYCEDGAQTGQQTCNADGTLTPCSCAAAPSNNGGAPSAGSGANPPRAALCQELRGSVACTARNYQSTALPSNILFVLDRSGSMACNPPPLQNSVECEQRAVPVDGAQPSKWQITVNALERVFDDLLDRGSTANVGLTFFSNDNTCGVQSDPSVPVRALSEPQVAALKSALQATAPSGGTPLVGATTLAYAYLHQEANQGPGCIEPCGANGNRFVVLITDGADSCPMPARPEDASRCQAAGSCPAHLVSVEAKLAAEANIRTFVIGAPGSEPARGYLSELAFVGGTARTAACAHDARTTQGDCHYDMTGTSDFANELAQVLASISSGAALGCEFGVPDTGDAVSEDEVNVQYQQGGTGDPVCFKYDDAPCAGGANGWQFAQRPDGTRDLSRVVICGAACESVRSDPAARVDVIHGCRRLVVD